MSPWVRRVEVAVGGLEAAVVGGLEAERGADSAGGTGEGLGVAGEGEEGMVDEVRCAALSANLGFF